MKTQEEIEQLAKKQKGCSKEYCDSIDEQYGYLNGYIDGYTQCQEDMTELLKAEIRRAFMHGQGNAQGMDAGLERDEIDEYTNWRMLSLTKQD